jgi:hypothetical protein
MFLAEDRLLREPLEETEQVSNEITLLPSRLDMNLVSRAAPGPGIKDIYHGGHEMPKRS